MEDITLYAGWRYNAPATERHTVTFDLNYEGAPTPETKSVDDGALVTEPEAPVRDGYRFTGWYREAGCTIPFDFKADRITEDTTLYAGWTRIKIVTFYMDGSEINEEIEGDMIPPDRIPFIYGTDTFWTWFKDEEGTEVFDFSSPISGDTHIYAREYSVEGVNVSNNSNRVLTTEESFRESFSGTFVIPFGITEIDNSAFSSCSNLESVIIPDSVTSIDMSAFYGCTNLGSITIPDSVKSIGTGAFNYCLNLESVTLPDGITTIESFTFTDCKGLKNITIPDSVTSIDSNAFSGCSGLTEIYIPDNVASIGDSAFRACNNLTSISLPAAFEGNIPDDRWGAPDTADITIRE